jgi:ankyrin repeat protein
MHRSVQAFFLATALFGAGCEGFFTPSTPRTTDYKPAHQAARAGDAAAISQAAITDPTALTAGDSEKDTPLHLAAYHNKIEVVKVLLAQRNVDVNARNVVGQTPLILAAKAGHLEVVRLLLVASADTRIADSRGWTAETWATKTRHDDVSNLLKKGRL